ncbi:MAG: hypothetical protein R8M45_11940 [Ghiorsea sp.]
MSDLDYSKLDYSYRVGDMVRVKGYDREFEVHGVYVGDKHPVTYAPCTMVGFSFTGYGGVCLTRRPSDELEKVKQDEVRADGWD